MGLNRQFQEAWNDFNDGKNGTQNLHYVNLVEDDKRGTKTKVAIKKARLYLGVGNKDWRKNSDKVTEELILTLRNPFRRIKGYSRTRNLARRRTASNRRRTRIKKWKNSRPQTIKGTSPGHPHWGGSRYVVEEAWAAAGKPYVSSTKRGVNHPLTISNPNSDHSARATRAFANDWPAYGATGTRIATQVGNHFGVRRIGTYQSFYVRRDGRLYRCQLLWQVPGHHDHDHFGARA